LGGSILARLIPTAAKGCRFRTRVLSPLVYLSGHVASFGDVRMTRRKFEITAHMNERNFPHIVELELPPGGFRTQSLEFEAFHREHHILIRRGRSDARQGRLSYRYQILQAPEPAEPDRLAPSRCAMRPAARQRRKRDAEIDGAAGSWRLSVHASRQAHAEH